MISSQVVMTPAVSTTAARAMSIHYQAGIGVSCGRVSSGVRGLRRVFTLTSWRNAVTERGGLGQARPGPLRRVGPLGPQPGAVGTGRGAAQRCRLDPGR